MEEGPDKTADKQKAAVNNYLERCDSRPLFVLDIECYKDMAK